MKRVIIITAAILSCLSTLKAQEKVREHKGFFLSMAAGPVFGKITDEISGDYNGIYNMDMDGVGAAFDFKIGGVISPNLILHATLISQTMSGPNIKISNNPSVKAPNELTIGEAMFGAGLTYYIMPQNIFFSGSLGLGNFTIMDETNDVTTSTQRGVSFQLKAGKEWWVSRRWGLGISVTYGKTNLTNSSGGITEKLDSNRLGILFNATLN
jgi:hypothetical protein